MEHILSICPNNSEAILFNVLKCIYNEEWWTSTSEKAMIAILENFLELPQVPAKATHLVLACSLLAKPKTVRALAAEYWTQLVARKQIDSAYLGQQIGKIQSINLFPLKRMTDIFIEQLMHISQQHNEALITLIENAILTMGEKPMKNTRQLLEILVEVKASLNNQSITNEVQLKLKNWINIASLKRLVQQLAA